MGFETHPRLLLAGLSISCPFLLTKKPGPDGMRRKPGPVISCIVPRRRLNAGKSYNY